jgi:hypothetical protein
MQALTFFFYFLVALVLIVFIIVSLLRRKPTARLEPTLDKQPTKPLEHTLPTTEQFRETLVSEYSKASRRPIEEMLLARILDVFTKLYAPRNGVEYDNYLSACLEGLTGFTNLAPHDILEPTASNSLFMQRLPLRDFFFDEQTQFRPAYEALSQPFKSKMQTLGFLDWENTAPYVHYRDMREGETKEDNDRYMKSYFKRMDDAYAELKKKRPHAWLFCASPLFPYVDRLVPDDLQISFALPEESRFRGQWIVAAPDSGKTTFISALIAEDLKKVARNEASIFVMDSQNELIPDIARLELLRQADRSMGGLSTWSPIPTFPLH